MSHTQTKSPAVLFSNQQAVEMKEDSRPASEALHNQKEVNGISQEAAFSSLIRTSEAKNKLEAVDRDGRERSWKAERNRDACKKFRRVLRERRRKLVQEVVLLSRAVRFSNKQFASRLFRSFPVACLTNSNFFVSFQNRGLRSLIVRLHTVFGLHIDMPPATRIDPELLSIIFRFQTSHAYVDKANQNHDG